VSADEDENLCLICHLLLKEPVLTSCGHGFCKECPEEHSRRCGVIYVVTCKATVSFISTSECLSQGLFFTHGTSVSLSTRKSP